MLQWQEGHPLNNGYKRLYILLQTGLFTLYQGVQTSNYITMEIHVLNNCQKHTRTLHLCKATEDIEKL